MPDPRKIAEERRRRAFEAQRRKEERTASFRLFLSRLVIFAAMFALLLILSISMFFINLHKREGVAVREFTYQIGTDEDEDRLVRELKLSDMTKNGKIYIDLTELAGKFGFTTTGNINEIRFISKSKDNDSVKFETNSAVAYINNVRVRMTSPTVSDGERILVPLDFLTTYFKGVDINLDDENNKLTISRITEPGENGSPRSRDITFTLKNPVTSESIPEDTLATEILAKTTISKTAETK